MTTAGPQDGGRVPVEGPFLVFSFINKFHIPSLPTVILLEITPEGRQIWNSDAIFPTGPSGASPPLISILGK